MIQITIVNTWLQMKSKKTKYRLYMIQINIVNTWLSQID